MQKKKITEGGTIKAEISQNELNRIFVASDRIKSIKSASSNFVLENDEDNGQIFIMPNPGNKEPISAFITTELGKTIPLALTPTDVAAQTLELVAEVENENLQPVLSYEAELVQLAKEMKNRKKPTGYIMEEPKKGVVKEKGLEKKELLVYRGKYIGKVVHVKNITTTFLSLEETHFMMPDIKAIAFSKKVLIPNEVAEVYVVCSIKNDRTTVS